MQKVKMGVVSMKNLCPFQLAQFFLGKVEPAKEVKFEFCHFNYLILSLWKGWNDNKFWLVQTTVFPALASTVSKETFPIVQRLLSKNMSGRKETRGHSNFTERCSVFHQAHTHLRCDVFNSLCEATVSYWCPFMWHHKGLICRCAGLDTHFLEKKKSAEISHFRLSSLTDCYEKQWLCNYCIVFEI